MILSDRWIDQQCNKKTCALLDKDYRFIKWLDNDLPAETLEEIRLGQHRQMLRDPKLSMIEPYVAESIRTVDGRNVLSYGVSSFGYDVRLAEEFKIFTNINSGVIDPKRLDPGCLVDAELRTDEFGDKYVLLPPNSYLLGRTVEWFRIPRDVTVICVGKSTYARAGAIVNVTPIEAGFCGNVVIEISNSTNLPLKIYAGEGACQFLFIQGNEPCRVSYADRNGKYQNQEGIQLPIV